MRLNAVYPGEQNHMAFSSVISYLIPVSLFFLASAFFLLNAFSIFDFPLDDALIHRVYSRSFAFGNGFQYNEGIQEAGQTSPLWAIISSPAHWIERLWGAKAMVAFVKLIGFALGIIIITTVRKMTEVISHSQMVGIVAASLFALEPRLLFSVFSGMENILLIALWVTATYQFIKKKWGISFLLFGLIPVTRKIFFSNIVIFSAFIGLVFSFSSFSRSFEDRRMQLASDFRAIHLINVSAGKWIKKNTSPDSKVRVNDSGSIRYFGDRFTVDLIGLNNSEIVFGGKIVEIVFKDIDWLAIFPSWFPELRSFFSERFVP